jgi:genome maintenance exonuclease 1
MINHFDHGVVLPKITRKTTKAGRRYFTPEGKAYPSITTMLGSLNKKSIMAWRKRVGEEEANKISTFAATRGTAVHKLAEDYIDNVPDYDKDTMPHNKAAFLDLKNIIDQRLDNVWFQEEFLYSNKLELAGQVDCIAEFDGQLSIIDFKTSRKPKKEEWIENYFIQAAFYAAAFYETAGIIIKQCVILITVDGHEPQVFKIEPYQYIPRLIEIRRNYVGY